MMLVLSCPICRAKAVPRLWGRRKARKQRRRLGCVEHVAHKYLGANVEHVVAIWILLGCIVS